MKTFDLITMCVQNLRRRKFRTFLTVIGVVIGTCSIISMISLGIGINESNSAMIAQWGDLTMIDVYGNMSNEKLDDTALTTFKALPNVSAVTPFVSFYAAGLPYESYALTGKNERYRLDINMMVGVYPEALEELGYQVQEGHFINNDSGKYIELIVGEEVAYMLTDTKRKAPHNVINAYNIKPGADPNEKPEPFLNLLDQTLVIKVPYGTRDNEKFLTYDAKIVGILKPIENNYETRYSIYINTSTMEKMAQDYQKATKTTNHQKKNYEQVKVRVTKLEEVGVVQKQITDMGYYTSSMEDVRQDAMKETQKMQMILGALGGISLLVASISIANTMVMSVYERTREIGVMKVLGCFVQDIRRIFLVEAALIGFLGGVLGVSLSYFISFLLNTFGGSIAQIMGLMADMSDGNSKISVIPLWLVATGMLFATFVGIIAGVYPAQRAVKISALEAIKQN